MVGGRRRRVASASGLPYRLLVPRAPFYRSTMVRATTYDSTWSRVATNKLPASELLTYVPVESAER